VDVAINAKTKEGPIKKVASMHVRVKRIPDPVAELSGKNGGAMPAGFFKVQIAPSAILKGFDFDARFTIISFTFGMFPKGKDYLGPYVVENRSVGCRLTDSKDIKAAMSTAKAGDRVFIENIKAIGPDKTVRTLGSLLFTLTN